MSPGELPAQSLLAQYWFNLLSVSAFALVLDRLLGEPRHHPLAWFGSAAARAESGLNNRSSKWRGVIAACGVIALPVAAVALLQSYLVVGDLFRYVLDTVILMFVIGWQSMKEHGRAVSQPLLCGDVDLARQQLSRIVSRDTDSLDESGIAGSAIESILENGHDSVFASLFWYALLGPAGALLHRLVNTLDAMWGYRNERFSHFGWFAARADDFLGWVPARLTALSYALCGSFSGAVNCWRRQTKTHKSPNAGVVMAAGAGALSIQFGGPVFYEGAEQDKPVLGVGPPATAVDIERSIGLIQRGIALWLGIFLLAGVSGLLF